MWPARCCRSCGDGNGTGQEKLVALAVKLDELADEARHDVAVVRDVLTCQDEVGRVTTYPTRADRLPATDGAGLLAAAKSGRSLLDPTPLPPVDLDQAGFVQIDRSHAWQQHPREPDLRGLER